MFISLSLSLSLSVCVPLFLSRTHTHTHCVHVGVCLLDFANYSLSVILLVRIASLVVIANKQYRIQSYRKVSVQGMYRVAPDCHDGKLHWATNSF